jgi:hypothetical protein
MGKRELLIIAGFVVVGALVYQFTAPPSTGTSSFSFANIFNEARREMRGNPGRANVTHTATIPIEATHRELRILRVTESVKVVGEDRADIEYALTVSSTGPDDAAAKQYADKTVFERDDVADSLVLRVFYPEEASQETSLVVKVPARLAVRVESAEGVTITGVAAAHIESARGDIVLTDIAGAVTGAHQDGDVTVTNAGSAKLRLLRLRSKFDNVRQGLTLDARDGECTILESAGPVEVDSQRAEITVTGHDGPVIVRGSDGRVTLDSPGADSKIDMRRAEVEVTLTGRVPVTILTTDQTARVIIKDTASVELDAMSTSGKIQAADVNLTPETVGENTKLVHTFGTGRGARVTIRNTRGEIVVRR